MSENLTIDEILAEAERVQKEIKKNAEAIKENVKNEAYNEPESKAKQDSGTSAFASQKTMPVPSGSADVKIDSPVQTAQEKTVPVSTKTRVVSTTQKTNALPDLSSTKSFFKKPSKDSIYDKEPPEFIEKPATIKSKSRFDKTSDLQEIPTILAIPQ